MAGLFDKQGEIYQTATPTYEAEIYRNARPTYPSEWYSMLAALTPHHTLAWDVGTGNGQAALGVAPIWHSINQDTLAPVLSKCFSKSSYSNMYSWRCFYPATNDKVVRSSSTSLDTSSSDDDEVLKTPS